MGLRPRVALGIAIVGLAAGAVGAWLCNSSHVDRGPAIRRTSPAKQPQPPAPERGAPAVSRPVAPTGGLLGVVEDARGEPIADASVVVLQFRPPGRPFDEIAMIRDLAVARAVVTETTSASDGRFQTAALAPGTYHIVARQSGRVAASASAIVPDATSQRLRLVLASGHRVEGTVVRKAGGTADGVTVVALSATRGLDFDPPDKPMAHADEKGAFVFDALPAGRWAFVAAPLNEGYSHVEEATVPLSSPLVLRLDGSGTLTGRVTDEQDAPIAGARVVAAFARGFGLDLEYGASVTTDADGRYELHGLSTASVELFFVEADGYCRYRGRVDQAREARRQDVRLSRGATVRGVVVGQGTKAPLADATITLVSVDSMIGGVRVAMSGTDGKFEIQGAPTGRSVLMARKGGWRQAEAANPMSLLSSGASQRENGIDERDTGTGAIVVVTRSGEIIERTIELFRPAILTGRVLTPDGKPLAAARIAAVREGEDADRRSDLELFLSTGERRPVSDADGRFEIDSPVMDGRVVVEAAASDRALRASVVVDVSAQKPPGEIELRLGTGSSIAGRVTDSSTGAPMAGVWMGWWTDEKPEGREFEEHEMGFAETAADGTYRFDLVTPGSVKMEVRGTPGRRYVWTSRLVTVEAGTVTSADFAIERALAISGRVTFSDGKPGATLPVEIQTADGEPVRLPDEHPFTDEEGAFLLEGLRPGHYRLVAHAMGRFGPERPSEPVVVAAGSSGVELRVPAAPSLVISGTVRYRDGHPVAGAEVGTYTTTREGRGEVHRPHNAATGADGSFRIEGLEPGEFDLTVVAETPRGRLDFISIRRNGVRAGSSNVVFEVERGARLSGRVVRPDGTSLPAGEVSCRPLRPANATAAAGGDEVLDGGSDAAIRNGEFELIGLAPGKHHVWVQAAGFAGTRVVAETGARDIVVRLVKEARVTGCVLLPDGKPATRAGVWIEDPDGPGATSTMCTTDDSGRFTLTGVGPGVHVVGASQDPYSEAEGDVVYVGEIKQVRVAEGGAVDGIEIRLKQTDRPK